LFVFVCFWYFTGSAKLVKVKESGIFILHKTIKKKKGKHSHKKRIIKERKEKETKSFNNNH